MQNNYNFSNYETWEKVVAPNGQTYYRVPETGYLYDPFQSKAKGRPVVYQDPRDAIKKTKAANSPIAQIAPALTSAGTSLATNYIAKQLAGPSVAGVTPAGQIIMSDGTVKAAEAAANAANASNAGVASTSTLPAGEFGGLAANAPVASAANGGTILADGTTAAPSLGVAPYLGAASAALGAYGINQAIDANSTKNAFTSGLGLGGGLATLAPLLLGTGPLGWGALGLSALAGGGVGVGLQKLLGSKSTKEKQADRWADVGKAGMGERDYFAGIAGGESRDESLLTNDAIRYNPDNYNAIEGWDKLNKKKQNQFLDKVRAEQIVEERDGGIYYDDERAKQIAEELGLNKSAKNKRIGAALATRLNR